MKVSSYLFKISILASFSFLFSSPSIAREFRVDSFVDGLGNCSTPGQCTLRQAVIETNRLPGADTLVLPAGTYNLQINGVDNDAQRGDLDISDDLTLQSENSDPASVVIQSASGFADRLFNVINLDPSRSLNVNFRNLTLAGGNANDPELAHDTAAGFASGGAILFQNPGNYSIVRSVFRNNHANTGYGGAIYLLAGNLSVSQSTFSENVANVGGAISVNGRGHLTLSQSTLNGNLAYADGGAIDLDNIPPNYNVTPSASISNSTLSGNTAQNSAYRQGAGIFAAPATLLVLNHVSLINNQGYALSGLAFTHTVRNPGAAAANTFIEMPLLNIHNSIFENNTQDCNIQDAAQLQSSSGNFSRTPCYCTTATLCSGFTTSTTDMTNHALLSNGGLTLTHALLSGSAAANQAELCAAGASDQRGVSCFVGSRRDSGSYELAPRMELSTSSLTFENTNVGGSRSLNLGITNVGDENLVLYNVPPNAPYTASLRSCLTVAPHSSCNAEVFFQPTRAGVFNQQLAIISRDVGQQMLNVSGRANASLSIAIPTDLSGLSPVAGLPAQSEPRVSFSSESIADFPVTRVGVTSTENRTLTLTNNSDVAVTINMAFAMGDQSAFAFSGSCPNGASLAARASCQIVYNFTPQSAGDLSAVFRWQFVSGGREVNVDKTLRGRGDVLNQSFSTEELAFPATVVGRNSSLAVTFFNNGLPFALDHVDITTRNAGVFSQTNDCPSLISTGGVCRITIQFSPGSETEELGVLNLIGAAGYPPSTPLRLRGRGVAPALLPDSEGAGTVGVAPAPLSVTFTAPSTESLSSGTFSVTATSSREALCHFYIDGTLMPESVAATYATTHSYSFSSVPAGGHLLKVSCDARDAVQAYNSFPFTVVASSSGSSGAGTSSGSGTSSTGSSSGAGSGSGASAEPVLITLSLPSSEAMSTGAFTVSASSNREAVCHYFLDLVSMPETGTPVYTTSHSYTFSSVSPGPHDLKIVCESRDAVQGIAGGVLNVAARARATAAEETGASSGSSGSVTSPVSASTGASTTTSGNVPVLVGTSSTPETPNTPNTNPIPVGSNTAVANNDALDSTPPSSTGGGGCSLQNTFSENRNFSVLVWLLSLVSLFVFRKKNSTCAL